MNKICKTLMKITIAFTIIVPIAIYLFYILPILNNPANPNYDSGLFKVEVMDKTNGSSNGVSYDSNFVIRITNDSPVNVNKFVGKLTIYNANDSLLLVGDVSIVGSMSANNNSTWDVTMNNRSAELWNTDYDDLKIYFRITEITFENGACIKYNEQNTLIKSAKTYIPGVNAYLVSFDTCGGNLINDKTVKAGNKVQAPTPTRDGYDNDDFLGWYVNAQYTEEFNFNTPIYQNIKLYAKWATRYRVIFDTNGGNQINSLLVKGGETVQEKIPTKTGYDFIDWYSEPEYIHNFDFNTQIYQDTTIYAKWVNSELNSEIFDFELSNSVYMILSYNGTDKEIILPKTHNGKSVTIIGAEAFYNSQIVSIVIPNSITSIHYNAFKNCTKLTAITIPDSVTSMGNSIFYGCTKLNEINLSKQITSISENTFYGCTSLTTVTIPNSVTIIYGHAFTNCQNLSMITIPNSVEKIDSGAFQGCSNLTTITLSNKITQIYDSTFDGCTNLTTITIPNSVTQIGNYAFQDCVNLTSIIIPRRVLYLGNYAFKGCANLETIIIPHNVTSIGFNVLDDCTGLTAIYCEIDSQPSGWSTNWKGNCSVEPIWAYTGEN